MKKLTIFVFVGILSSFIIPRDLLPGFTPGAYKLISQSFTDGQKTETTKVKQLKINTGHFMMYANVNPEDSTSSFGIGTYANTKNGVSETVIYSAWSHTSDDTLRNYDLEIIENPKGYQQLIKKIGQDNKYTLTEEYETVSTRDRAPLDGAWKQSTNYSIKGKDTAVNNAVEFKVYFAGHFVWGHTTLDSAGKKNTGIGFGSFKMNGRNKVKETVDISSYAELNGLVINIDLVFKDNDTFTQTINNSDGTILVEEYKRLR